MNKKLAIILTALLTTGAIAAVIISKQPKPNTCDLLFAKVVEAKTEQKKSFAEKRWLDTCNGDDATNRL